MPRRLALASVCLLAACGSSHTPPVTSASKLHPLGYRYVANDHHALPPSANHALLSLPPSADVSQYAPPVGDQGQIGDCMTWASGYDLCGWLANKAGLNGAQNFFAPMFMFRHFAPAGSADFGIDGDDAFNFLQSSGIDTAADYDQNSPTTFPRDAGASVPGLGLDAAANDNIDTPNAAITQNALNFRLGGYQRVFDTPPQNNPGVCPGYAGGTVPIQAAIASGSPVVIAIPVPPEFDNYDGVNPVAPPTATEVSRGGHAIFCDRYDANGLWCQNSWGTGWGAAGLVQLSWPFVEQCIWETDTGLGIGGNQVQGGMTLGITSPASGQSVSGVIPITVIVTPGPNPISGVSLQVNGNTVGAATSLGLSFNYQLDTTQLGNGSQSLVAVASDSAGNQANSDPVSIVVANGSQATGPGNLAVTFANLSAGQVVHGTVQPQLTASGQATGAAVNQIQLVVDGNSATAAAQSGASAQFTLDTTQLGDGAHTLAATATASDGESATGSVSIVVDNTGPVVTLTSPAAGAVVSGALTLAADATDAASNVTQVVFYVNGAAVGSATVAPYSLSWDSTQVADGTISISASAYDDIGNVTNSQAVAVTLQNQAPPQTSPLTISFGSDVSASSSWTGTVSIDVDVADSNASAAVTGLSFFANSLLIGSVTAPPYAISWDTTQVVDGDYSLQVTVTDSLGNQAQTPALAVTVAN